MSKTWCVYLLSLAAAACAGNTSTGPLRISGNVEATEVQVSPEVGGRLMELRVQEGDRVRRDDPIARLDTADIDLQLQRARAERTGADAQLRLVLAGARPEDIRQAEAQVNAAETDVAAAAAEHTASAMDLERFEALLK